MNNVDISLNADSELKISHKKIRDANIELGRICCFMSIVGVHVLPYFVHDSNTVSKAATIIGVCCKMFATPFFFLTMGAFMSSGTPYRKQLARVIRKIVIPFTFTFFLMIQFIPLIKKETGVLGTLTRLHVDLSEYFYSLATVSFKSFDYTFHLWFISAMFLCYLLLPIFKIFLYDSQIDKRYKISVILVGIIVFIVPQTLKIVSTDVHIQRMTIALPQFPFFWIWLLLLGSYIHGWLQQSRDAVAPYVIWLAPPVFFAFCMMNFHFTEIYDLKPDLTADRFAFTDIRENITVFLPNLLPFIWFHCIRVRDAAMSKAILFISNKSFYMYIIHVPVMVLFQNYINIDNRKSFVGHFLHWLLVVCLSFAIACVLKYFERCIYSLAAKLWSKISIDNGALPVVFRRGGGG